MNAELTKDQQEQLKKLQAEADCGKKPMLCNGDCRNLPKVKKIGNEGLFECHDKRAANCPKAVPYGSTFFCRCHARAYLYRKLGI